MGKFKEKERKEIENIPTYESHEAKMDTQGGWKEGTPAKKSNKQMKQNWQGHTYSSSVGQYSNNTYDTAAAAAAIST